MKRVLFALSLLAFAACADAVPLFPFQNGSFESSNLSCPSYGVSLGSTDITGWTVSRGDIDWLCTGTNWNASDGTHSLDLIGDGTIGGVQQTFLTTPNAWYRVTFDLAGNPSTQFPPTTKSLDAIVDGVTHSYVFETAAHAGMPATSTTNMGWVTHAFSFVATGSDTLEFVSPAANSNVATYCATNFPGNTFCGTFAGAALDNVRVTQLFAPGTTVWTVSAASASNPSPCPNYPDFTGCPQPPTAIDSSPTIVSNGVGAPAVFTYATVNSYCCHTGTWTFQTTAAAPGNVNVDWAYAGYHGTCEAYAKLTAFVTRSGSTIYSNDVYFANDSTCNGYPPSGGFDQQGNVTFSPPGGMQTGDTYGFTMVASNYDQNGGVSGRLEVSGGTPVLAIPSAPTIGTATAGNASATVTFTPATTGGAAASFTATSNPGNVTGTCTAPCTTIQVSGLNNGTPYTFTVTATNAAGTSPPSAASNPVTPSAPLAAAPTLIGAFESSGNTATVIGRINGSLSGASVQAVTVGSCNAGVPGGSVTPIGSPTSPNADGYVVATASGVPSAQFVALELVQGSTPASGVSACAPSIPNNDFWTTAFLVGNNDTSAGTASVADYVGAAGESRWYIFKVAPGQQISVSLTGASGGALPADYDLAVFKDIYAAFVAQVTPSDSTALTKLNAEYAPSTFSPSTFSPSTFSPSTFSPSTFSPSTFSPSTFSPSTFSPSTFSPSTFSPSTFSPSTFSPSTFSPSTFSPSTFSPSTFSPSTFSPSTFSPSTFSPSTFSPTADVIASAFSSAQTRSLIGVSATAGTVPESVVVDSWNNSGYFYARVTGRNGAFSTSTPFNIAVTKSASTCGAVTDTALTAWSAAPANSIQTIILTDTSKFPTTIYPAGDVSLMNSDLATLAASTHGVVIDVAGSAYTRAQQLKAQAAAHSDCPFATNLVAEEIKGIVDSYRANNPLKFVVIAGGDDVIPFFRYPDETMIGEESGYVPPVAGASDASLRGNFVLSQDTYGSKTRISLRVSDYPVPGLAVGRLVKTPAEISGMIEAALPNLTTVNGALQPASSLVTGYDFLADDAQAVAGELSAATNVASSQLITANGVAPQDPRPFASGGPWTANDLRAALLGTTHYDVVFLAGHFSANSALAADFATNLITSDLAGSNTNFTNTIVFSAGCHSGYSIVNSDALPTTFTLDWAEAFAQKKATLIAGTGYQYGDTDFIEYGERLYLNFARELHAGNGPVNVGEALVNAKIDYLAATPDIRGIHTKALLEATLYGLPMLGVNMPAGRGAGGAVTSATPAITPVPVTGTGVPAGLSIANISVSPTTTPHPVQLTGATLSDPGPLVTWLQGDDGVVSNPSEPAIPLKVVNATPNSDTVLRGVGFRGGSYTDSTIVPLTGAPATDIRGVHVPFAAPNFFPNRPWTVNYFGKLFGNGATSLLVTPAQHRGAGTYTTGSPGFPQSILRKYSSLNLELYYSSNRTNAALSDAPTIVAVDAQGTTGNVVFTAQVVGDPAAAIYQAWVVYTDGGGNWVPVDLAQCDPTALPAVCGSTADSQIWKGVATISASAIQYVVQAASGTGLVTLDDNRGAYYSLALTQTQITSTTQQAAAAAPTTLGFVAGHVPTTATYGDTVSVTANLTSAGQPVSGGLVTMNIGGFGNSGLTDVNGNVTLTATASSAPGAGVPISAAYAGSVSLLPSTAATAFTVNKAPVTLTPLASGVGVTATAPVVVSNATTQQPLAGQSISYLFSGTAAAKTIVVNTDTNGNATVPTAGLPAGTYSVTATFLPANLAGKDAYYTAPAAQGLASFTMNAQTLAFTSPTPTAPVSAPVGTFSVAAALTGPNAGLPIAITSTTTDVCTVTGQPTANQVTYTATILRGDANCVLSADVTGNNNYAPARAPATISIVKAAQTITSFTAPAAVTYAPPGTFTGSATAASPNSGQAVTITSATTGVCTVADAANLATSSATYTATIVSGGANCVINADLNGNNYYTAAHAQATIPIVKATQAITITGLSSDCTSPVKTYGNPPFGVSVTGSASGIPVTVTSTTSGICSASYSAGTATLGIDGAGTCRISADQAGNSLYTAAPTVTQCFTVAQAGQTILNFATIPTKTYGVDPNPFTVSADAKSSAGLTVSLSAAGQCTLTNPTLINNSTTLSATVTLTHKGTCTITASAPGDANHVAVNPAQAFNIKGTPQTISFAPGDKALGTPAFPLVATATSGLPVTFAVEGTTDVCTLNGATVKLLSPGVCTVTASQSGANSDYAAATNSVQSFKVYLSGLAGLTSVTIAANALVDSFDSTPGLGGYAATKNALVNVLSNGTINVQGAKVWGNVESATANVVLTSGSLVTGNVTAATTISNSGSVGGTTAANQPLPTIFAPAVVACSPFTPATPSGWISGNYSYNATKGDLTVSGQNTATLAAGTYCLNSITLSGGATLAVNGAVKITLTGAFTASGNGVANPAGIPRNLQIVSSYTGNNGVTMSGNATGYMTVYAPGTSVTLSGNAQMFGAVVGKSYTGSGNHQMHYDVQTLNVWGPIFGF